MGSRSRKKKALKAQEKLSYAERVKLDREHGLKAFKRENSRAAKASEWVHTVESTGHQYIGGDRAPRVSLSREDKKRNRKARRSGRSNWLAGDGVAVTEYGVKRRVGADTGRIVSSETVTRVTYVQPAAPEGGARGNGHPVRTGEHVNAGPDAGHLSGHTGVAISDEHQRAYIARPAYHRPREIDTEQPAHNRRHTHTGDCELFGTCQRNMFGSRMPANTQSVPAVDTGDTARADTARAREAAVKHAREAARGYRGGSAVRATVPTTDARGNIVQTPTQW